VTPCFVLIGNKRSLRERCNVILPGQYYDVETGLSYNYQRDYDPATGRYVESDPIGLRGGNYSTYGYAGEDPVSLTDPLGLWVKLCSRWVGSPKNSRTSQTNPFRHDYLDVSGQFIGFYSAPGSNPAWGKGVVAGQGEQDGGRCSPLCNDNKFDAYVLQAAQEIGAPTYCATASASWGLGGLVQEAEGARNCQSWASDVIAKAKKNYLAHEKCATCFKD
jgi:RHS repeat-associated protein